MARVAVVGSYGVGLTFGVERAPESGETVIGRAFRAEHGGKGSNQAVGAARLGADVRLLTALGEDSFGADALALWAAEGVEASAVVRVPLPTMAGAILVDAEGENRIVIVQGALAALTPEHVDRFAPLIAAADVCLVQLEIPLETAWRALEVARRERVRTVLDPAPAPPEPPPAAMLELVDHLTPNESEAAALGDAIRTVRSLVVTRGAAGAVVGGQHVPAFVASVLDTTGAGDAFTAAFSVALAEGRPELDAVRWGCAAGAHMVEHRGVVPGLPTRAELESRLGVVAPV